MIKLLLAAKILAHIMIDCQVVLSNVYKTSESFFPYVFVLGGSAMGGSVGVIYGKVWTIKKYLYISRGILEHEVWEHKQSLSILKKYI